MALPFQFANATTGTGAQLDANNAALGKLTPIPCAASGSNTITLTALADTPTVTAYSNYMQFTAIAALSNTGATTAKVGSSATLPVYKNSPSGPVALVGGEIVAGVAITLLYDSALNSGSGGFHLLDGTSITASGGTIAGPVVGTGSLATITYPVAVFPLLTGVTLASISRLSVGGGQTISHILYTATSLSFAALNPQTGTTANITLAGTSLNDIVTFNVPVTSSVGISYRGFVPNGGTVTMQVFNGTAATITPVAGTYGIQAIGYS